MKPILHPTRAAAIAAIALTAVWGSSATALEVVVTIENLAPAAGTFLTPTWVGFHNGSFDLYDSGSPASAELERLAEDGNATPLSDAFDSSGQGAAQGVLFGPGGPIAPGESASMTFTIDPSDPMGAYFSYASMVIPSNDGFIANGDPMAHSLFDSNGNFNPFVFVVSGSNVLDAGTEVNDELPMNTAFFGQMMANAGVTENGVVSIHPGFLPPGSGGILDDPMFKNADFTRSGYKIARITVSAIPLPAGAWLLMSGLVALVSFGRKRRQAL